MLFRVKLLWRDYYYYYFLFQCYNNCVSLLFDFSAPGHLKCTGAARAAVDPLNHDIQTHIEAPLFCWFSTLKKLCILASLLPIADFQFMFALCLSPLPALHHKG